MMPGDAIFCRTAVSLIAAVFQLRMKGSYKRFVAFSLMGSAENNKALQTLYWGLLLSLYYT